MNRITAWVVILPLMVTTSMAATIVGRVTCRSLKDNADVVVFIARPLNGPEVHFRPPEEAAVMEQTRLRFEPHILPVVVGTRVAFLNSDEVGHNVFSASRPRRFNLGTYPQGVVKYVVFNQTGVVALLCNFHAEMSAYIVVIETPYFAVTDKKGRFVIENAPPGRHLLKTWHERLNPTSWEIEVADGLLNLEIELKK